jgi:hypothetical protein
MGGKLCKTHVQETKEQYEKPISGAFREGTKMEKITFKDGTVINAEKNGTCFITGEKPTFPDDLTNITIGGETATTIENGKIVECASIDGRYWFTIIEASPEELEKRRIDETIMELSELVGVLLG